MIFPGFPGVLLFFQVFQVEWEPCNTSRESEMGSNPILILSVSIDAALTFMLSVN